MDWVDELSVAWRREHPRLDTSALPPLVRLARLLLLGDAFQRQVLAPFEITVGDYGVLAVLRRAGKPYELSPSELYGRLQRSSGVSRSSRRPLGPGALDGPWVRQSIAHMRLRASAVRESRQRANSALLRCVPGAVSRAARSCRRS